MKGFTIVSFNVNGLISFSKRRGYDKSSFPSLIDNICVNNEIKSSLNIEKPEVICIQECKMNYEDDLDYNIGCPTNYESYFSLPQNNKRYSGVATYCLKDKVNVIEAANGFSWMEENIKLFDIHSKIQLEDLESIYKDISNINILYGFTLKEIDNEGRCILTDHYHYILINIYVPLIREKIEDFTEKEDYNTGNIDLDRLKYRLAFHESLNIMLKILCKLSNRKVILLGDFNIILNSLDSYNDIYKNLNSKDLETIIEPNDILNLKSSGQIYNQVRKLNIKLIEDFQLSDVYRLFYPTNRHKYTCWNQINHSRGKNQGARIDLFLVSQELIPKILRCEILDHIYGSDHCPIALFLVDNIDNNFKSLNLNIKPPSLCSKYLPQCKQRQSTIKQFLKSKSMNNNATQIKNTLKDKLNKTEFTSTKKKDMLMSHKPIPLCKHGIACIKKKVTRAGINKGRYYWSCSKVDQQKCNSFIWVESNSFNNDMSNFLLKSNIS